MGISNRMVIRPIHNNLWKKISSASSWFPDAFFGKNSFNEFLIITKFVFFGKNLFNEFLIITKFIFPPHCNILEILALHAGSVIQSCPTLYDSMDCNLPGSSIHGIFQARIPEWVAISYSRGSSRPRDWTCGFWVSCISTWILYHCTAWEAYICLTCI